MASVGECGSVAAGVGLLDGMGREGVPCLGCRAVHGEPRERFT